LCVLLVKLCCRAQSFVELLLGCFSQPTSTPMAAATGSTTTPAAMVVEENGWVLEGSGEATPTEQATAVAPALPASMPALRAEAVLERPRTTAEAHELAAVLSVVAPVVDSAARAPLRLVAVLDKSGSMRGDKLRLVQQTMRFMLRHLGEQDQLGLVEYDTTVKVLAPLTTCDVDGRDKLDAALARLRPGYQTNLSGGLLKGLDLHRDVAGAAPVASASIQQLQFGNTYRRLSREDAEGRQPLGVGPPPPGAERVHEWTMELRFESPEDAALVQKVRYTLHETFADPVVEVVEPPFCLTRVGWGTFAVKAQLVLNDGRTLELEHDLSFGPPETIRTVLLPLRPTPAPSVQALMNPAHLEEAAVRSTFLFTDGLANVGIQKTDDLCAAVRGALEELGDRRCTLSTFGFGADHSAALLQGLAEVGGGIYSYVESEDQIGQAFGEALGGLLSTTHQNAQLSLKLTPGVTLARVCTDFAYERSEEDGAQTVVVEAADLFAEERRDILVMLKLPSAIDTDSDQVLGHFCARAFSVVMSRSEAVGPVELIVRRQESVDIVESNPHVERHRSRYLTTEALSAANQVARQGQLAEARRILSEAASKLSASDLGAHGDSVILGLIASLTDCQNDLRDQHQYRSVGDKKMTCMSMAHSRQRTMNLHATNVYATPSSSGMKSFFKSSVTR